MWGAQQTMTFFKVITAGLVWDGKESRGGATVYIDSWIDR